MRYWIGLTITVFVGLAAATIPYFIDPTILRALTSFVIGYIIGYNGAELTSRWAKNDPYR